MRCIDLTFFSRIKLCGIPSLTFRSFSFEKEFTGTYFWSGFETNPQNLLVFPQTLVLNQCILVIVIAHRKHHKAVGTLRGWKNITVNSLHLEPLLLFKLPIIRKKLLSLL